MLNQSCCTNCSEIFRKRPRCKSLKCPEYINIKRQEKEFEKMEKRTKILRFFKQDNKWYADVPGRSLADNEMVMGADVMLELLSTSMYCKNPNEVNIKLIDEKVDGIQLLAFKREDHDEDGAYYSVSGFLYREYVDMLTSENGLFDGTIWICNVTHDVFGEHPEYITILDIYS